MRAMMALRTLGPILLVGIVGPVLGCSAEEQACLTICECEHCNDVDEELQCNELQTRAAVAEAYGCDTQWSNWLACVMEKGECQTEQAIFSTKELGVCGSTSSIGVSCVSDTDCEPFGFNATCSGSECVQRTCEGPGEIPCERDDQCPGGADRCAAPYAEVIKCQTDASADPALHQGPEP